MNYTRIDRFVVPAETCLRREGDFMRRGGTDASTAGPARYPGPEE